MTMKHWNCRARGMNLHCMGWQMQQNGLDSGADSMEERRPKMHDSSELSLPSPEGHEGVKGMKAVGRRKEPPGENLGPADYRADC